MGETSVMTYQQESADEEVLIERIEIVDTEQSGGSESGDGSSGDGSDGDENIIWHDDPNQPADE
jgi:hypothetical protein